MAQRGLKSPLSYLAIDKKVGLDTGMQAPAIQVIIDSNRALARGLGINGTPEFIVGTTPVPGALGLKDLNNLVGRVRQEKR